MSTSEDGDIYDSTESLVDSFVDLNTEEPSNLFQNIIPTYNKSIEAFKVLELNQEVSLPVIVVVGAQNAGKSSVLESLVQKKFLPRGEGLMTRCPIILQLNQTNSNFRDGSTGKEWVEFGHDRKIPKTQWAFRQVEDEITKQTIKLAGKSNIVDEPITVSVFSPNVVNLTVIDLPGIVKNATLGQDVDIKEQINQLIMTYISVPTTIILAISDANNDIATSDSIEIAKKVDPLGERTLGVITKLDDCSRDYKILEDVLAGKIIPLKYGFVAVRNQSIKDLENGLTMHEVRLEEERLLNRKFPLLAFRNGTAYLAKRLSQLLIQHIRKLQPQWETHFAGQIKTLEEEMLLLGSDDSPNKTKVMCAATSKFCKKWDREFEGMRRNIDITTPCGAVRVKMIFLDIFEFKLAAVDPLEEITDEMIAVAIGNSAAMESGLSVPEAASQDLVKREIERLYKPCEECVEDVHSEMEQTIEKCLDPQIRTQYPLLANTIVETITRFLREQSTEVIRMMKYHIKIEQSYVTTSRQDFQSAKKKLMKSKDITDVSFSKSILSKVGNSKWKEKMKVFCQQKADVEKQESYDSAGEVTDSGDMAGTLADAIGTASSAMFPILATTAASAVISPPLASVAAAAVTQVYENSMGNQSQKKRKRKDNSENLHSTGTMDNEIVRRLIKLYFEIVRQSIRDYVPKLIVCAMINHTCDNLSTFLSEHLHNPASINNLVVVSDEATVKRANIRKKLQRLKEGEKIIQEFRPEPLI